MARLMSALRRGLCYKTRRELRQAVARKTRKNRIGTNKLSKAEWALWPRNGATVRAVPRRADASKTLTQA